MVGAAAVVAEQRKGVGRVVLAFERLYDDRVAGVVAVVAAAVEAGVGRMETKGCSETGLDYQPYSSRLWAMMNYRPRSTE